MKNPKAALRSLLISVIGFAGTLLVLAGAISSLSDTITLPSWWATGIAVVTGVAAVARTVIGYLDKGTTGYGLGSEPAAIEAPPVDGAP